MSEGRCSFEYPTPEVAAFGCPSVLVCSDVVETSDSRGLRPAEVGREREGDMVPRMVRLAGFAGKRSSFRPHCSGCGLAHDVSAGPVPGRPRRQLAVGALD